jgi:hypothetical protein
VDLRSRAMNEVTRLVRPSMRCARVVYFTDMTRAGAGTIPLGVFCEIKTAHIHGLALKARTLLGKREIGAITPVFRPHLTNPFKFLGAEFDAAWQQTDENCALGFLTRKHSTSLSALAPYHPAAADRGWWRGLLAEPEVDALLKTVIDREFAALMTETPAWDDGPGQPPVVRMQLAEAA